MNYFLLFPILFPVIIGIALLFFRHRETRIAEIIGLISVIITSASVLYIFLMQRSSSLTVLRFADGISISFSADGLGGFFAVTVAFLWIFSFIYARIYMRSFARKYTYFAFYIITYGSVMGIALAENLLTLYFFYEILTFVTLPLILHTQTVESRRAGRHYLYYSLSGSSLALSGIVIITVNSGSNAFVSGGIVQSCTLLTSLAYLLLFFGFGVKAAVLPVCGWLPEASSAPTPTTALLHAVAVVKSGAFAIIRVTYEIFSPTALRGSTAQAIALACAALTIIYGSGMAVREQHFKRRFAYSTVANLSYILVGALLCTDAGLHASLLHFLFHSITKIGLFFMIGAIIETTGAHYVYELNGLGKRMRLTFLLYTVSGCSLVGIPFFAGFVSKYYLVSSGLASNSLGGYIGVGAIIISAILTAYYVFSVSFRAFAVKPMLLPIYNNAREVEKGYLLIGAVFAALAVALGIWATPVSDLISQLVGGIV